MSIPDWLKEKVRREDSDYAELIHIYPKSIKYIQEEDFWVLNHEMQEIMSKSSFLKTRKQKDDVDEIVGLMKVKLKHLAAKLIEDGYDLKPSTFEEWFEMLCRKLQETTSSSPNIRVILTILAIDRGQRKNPYT